MQHGQIYTYDVEQVFISWYASLCYFAFRHVRDNEVAEDIVREIFVRLLEKKPVFESELHLKNFMYRTTKNDCLNYLRQRLSHERYVEYMRREGEAEEEDCQVMEAEIFATLRKAVEQLPTECRKVFELCYFEGLDNAAAAGMLHISVETVKAQKKRGKKILRDKLGGLYPLFVLLLSL